MLKMGHLKNEKQRLREYFQVVDNIWKEPLL
jgi:hypothetical protein